MHVGVFLFSVISVRERLLIPHARGGVSRPCHSDDAGRSYSPCTWGCFYRVHQVLSLYSLFPMHVGVFLASAPPPCSHQCYSPCTWGCFFRSAQVKIVADIIPHARGGVSSRIEEFERFGNYSPCTWGCFQRQPSKRSRQRLFPMHVGVFLLLASMQARREVIPHARGGVSRIVEQIGT